MPIGLKTEKARFWITAPTRDRQVKGGVEIVVADVGLHFEIVGIEVVAGANLWAKQVRVNLVVPHRGSISLTRHKLTLR